MKLSGVDKLKAIVEILHELKQEDFSFYAYQQILTAVQYCEELQDEFEILKRQSPDAKMPTLADGIKLRLAESNDTVVTNSKFPRAMLKVIVMDDDENMLNYLQVVGVEHEFQFLTAIDQEQLQQHLNTAVPDAILVDIMMPVLGFEILRDLKKRPELVHVPVFLGSSRNYERDRLQAMHQGAEKLIQKPYDLDALSRLIHLAHTRLRVQEGLVK